MINKMGVVGGGSWGTTIAVLLGEKRYNVNFWVREKEVVEEINKIKENTRFLKNIKIPDNVKATDSLKEVVSDADLIVNAVPAQFTRDVAKKYASFVKEDCIIVNVAKGIEISTYKTMSQVLGEELNNSNIVTLGGPNHAEEVSKKIPTGTVIAGNNPDILETVKEIFSTDYFKVYPIKDKIGVEICGAIKNITAIAIGICNGLGYGDSGRASILTWGLNEMIKFGEHFGAKKSTFYCLAGVGDLIATCISKHSRNNSVGIKLAKGMTLDEIKNEMGGMIAEGVFTTKAVYEYSNKHNIEMPLTKQVYKVLYEKKDTKKAISDFIRFV